MTSCSKISEPSERGVINPADGCKIGYTPFPVLRPSLRLLKGDVMDTCKVDQLIKAYVDADAFIYQFWKVFNVNPPVMYCNYDLRTSHNFKEIWRDIQIQFVYPLFRTLKVDFVVPEGLLNALYLIEVNTLNDRPIQIGCHAYANGLDYAAVLQNVVQKLGYHFQEADCWNSKRVFEHGYQFSRESIFTDERFLEVVQNDERPWGNLLDGFERLGKFYFPNRGGDMSLASCHLRIEFSRLVTHLRSLGYTLPKDYEYPSFGLHEQSTNSDDTIFQNGDTTTVFLKNGLDPKDFGGRPGLLVGKILETPWRSWEVSPVNLGSLFGIQIHDEDNEFFNTLRAAIDSA